MQRFKKLESRGRLLVAVIAVWFAHSHLLAQDSIPWARDLNQAQKTASDQRRLILLHFWIPDCPPCQTVERYVFSHPEVARTIAAGYVPLNVNAQAVPEVAKKYGVDRWPSDVIVSPEGEMLSRTVSPKDAREYIAMLNRVSAAKGAASSDGSLAQNPRQQPPAYQANPYQTNHQDTNPLAANSLRGDNRGAGESQYAPPRFQAAAGAQTTPGFGQYSPSTGPSAPGPRDRNPPASGGSFAAPGGEFEPGIGAELPAQKWPENNHQPARIAGLPNDSRQPALPAGRGPDNRQVTSEFPVGPSAGRQEKPLAMGGFCPVTLVESQPIEWRRGSVEFGAIHRGRTYLFAGKREQTAFLADPDRYSPVLSGCDPVRFFDHHEFVQGKQDFGFLYRDQIFLFADEASLKRFEASPDSYARQVHQAMMQNASGTRLR